MKERELAAELVLGLAEPGRRLEIERRLREDPTLREEVVAMEAMTGRLGDLPANAWPRPPIPAAPARSRRLRVATAAAALIVVLAIGIGIGELLAGGGSSGPATAALTLEPLEPGSTARASIEMPDPETMVLDVSGLEPAGPGHYYEVWLMSSDTKLVPIASFSVDAEDKADIRVPLPASPAAYRYFDISRQAESEGTGHSGESVLRGGTVPG
jgi:anti-sigma-K factor RskA